MPDMKKGRIAGVNGNMLTVEFETAVTQNEVAYAILGDLRLKSEVIRVRGQRADLQVFESTSGLKVGDIVEFTDDLLCAELGPGLLKKVYDGLQNPLDKLAEKSGFFLQRGVYLDPLEREKALDRARWAFLDGFEWSHAFNFEALCIYRCKLMILEKWAARRAGNAEDNLDHAASRAERSVEQSQNNDEIK